MRTEEEVRKRLNKVKLLIRLCEKHWDKYRMLYEKALNLISDLWRFKSSYYKHQLRKLDNKWDKLLSYKCSLEWVLNEQKDGENASKD